MLMLAMQVIYTDGLNPPAGYVQEEDKKMEDADINKGHGGKCIYRVIGIIDII